jgi:hypothetical protein
MAALANAGFNANGKMDSQQVVEEQASAEIDADAWFHAIVIAEHVSDDELQLNLKIGDTVCVVEVDESGWVGGHKVGEEDVSGWFPQNCIRRCDAQSTPQPCAETKQESVVASPMVSKGCDAASPLVTSTESPFRQKRAVATPQAAGKVREAGSEVDKCKEELLKSTRDLAIATEKLEAERDLRQRLEHELQQQNAEWERKVQELRLELERVSVAKNSEIESLNGQMSLKEQQCRNLEHELEGLRASVQKMKEAGMSKKPSPEQAPRASVPRAMASPPPPVARTSCVADARENISQPEAPPCKGSVLAHVREFERRSSSQTRAPAPRNFSREMTPRRSDSWIISHSREVIVGGERTLPAVEDTLGLRRPPSVVLAATPALDVPGGCDEAPAAPVFGLSPLRKTMQTR